MICQSAKAGAAGTVVPIVRHSRRFHRQQELYNLPIHQLEARTFDRKERQEDLGEIQRLASCNDRKPPPPDSVACLQYITSYLYQRILNVHTRVKNEDVLLKGHVRNVALL